MVAQLLLDSKILVSINNNDDDDNDNDNNKKKNKKNIFINKYAEEAIVVHWSLTISVFAHLNNIITPINNNYSSLSCRV